MPRSVGAQANLAKKRAKQSAETGVPAPEPVKVDPGQPPMRILEMQVENVKKVQVVEITPKGNMVEITGANGSGKTSVLDAIEYALRGTTNLPSQVMRRGTERARIVLNLGDLIVTRKWVRDGSPSGYLTVEDRGSKSLRRSPQTVLDALMGKISFDPLEFMRMRSEEQLETLRKLVPVAIDIDALDAENKRDYDERRQLKKDAAALEVKASEIAVPRGLPEHPVDVDDLVSQMREAGRRDAEIAEAKNRQERIAREIVVANDRRAASEKKAVELRKEAARLVEEANEVDLQANELFEVSQDLIREGHVIAIPEPIDTAPIEEQISSATAVNAGINRREQKGAIEREIQAIHAKVEELTRAQAERERVRTAAIAEAKMPVEGLGFGEGEVTYNDLPFEQLSDGEKIRISVALAMAANPTIRVLRIKDGSLLDTKTLAAIGKMADTHNYQAWVERVDTTGEVGIVMEEGRVVKGGK